MDSISLSERPDEVLGSGHKSENERGHQNEHKDASNGNQYCLPSGECACNVASLRRRGARSRFGGTKESTKVRIETERCEVSNISVIDHSTNLAVNFDGGRLKRGRNVIGAEVRISSAINQKDWRHIVGHRQWFRDTLNKDGIQ